MPWTILDPLPSVLTGCCLSVKMEAEVASDSSVPTLVLMNAVRQMMASSCVMVVLACSSWV